MRKYDLVFMMTAALYTAACGGGTRPVPLYPHTPQPLRSEQVSTLTGYVQFVDGNDVSSLGGPFELLPGCHVIGTLSRWGDQSPGADVVVTAITGRWTFALPMRAGHQYWIKVIAGTATGPVGPLTIKG